MPSKKRVEESKPQETAPSNVIDLPMSETTAFQLRSDARLKRCKELRYLLFPDLCKEPETDSVPATELPHNVVDIHAWAQDRVTPA